MKNLRRQWTTRTIGMGASIFAILTAGSALAGAVYTTDRDGTLVNANTQYASAADVYLNGGPQNINASGLTDGNYYFQVTDPSGRTLLSMDNASCRQVVVTGGHVSGASPASSSCAHANGTPNTSNGSTPVQLAPFSATPNPGFEYKVWLIPKDRALVMADPKVLSFNRSSAKTDNFKIRDNGVTPPVPVGSCQPSSSLSVLVSGSNVVSYVPKGAWISGNTGVSVVNIEGSSIVPTLIPTPNAVNSCASNPLTGITACTANNVDVYLFSGISLTSTLTSSGSGFNSFSGGSCTNCGVAMDATNNRAVVGLSIGGQPGFQFLNLATNAFEPAQLSPAGIISENLLIDPIRNLLLSASENGNYEIANITSSTSPSFFENQTGGGELDSSGMDCSTGIALAPAEFSDPSSVFIADLTQATYTPGTPGSWVAPSQNQILSESHLSAGASGIAVAQGTHIGVVSGEFGGDGITAIALPSTSGSGTPAISDWVSCSIGNSFNHGLDPHTLTAYKSPASGDPISIHANMGASVVAVVNLKKMLDPTIVPRTVGGHACAGGVLPPTVVSFVSVP